MNSFFSKAVCIAVFTLGMASGAAAREAWEAPHEVMGGTDHSNTMSAAKQGEHNVPCHGVVDCRRKSGGHTYVTDALHNSKSDIKPPVQHLKD